MIDVVVCRITTKCVSYTIDLLLTLTAAHQCTQHYIREYFVLGNKAAKSVGGYGLKTEIDYPYFIAIN